MLVRGPFLVRTAHGAGAGERTEGGFPLERRPLEWETALSSLAGACTMCRSNEEWAANEHARETGIVAGAKGATRVGPAVRVSASRGSGATSSAWVPGA